MKIDLAGTNPSNDFKTLSKSSKNNNKDETIYYKYKDYLVIYRISRGLKTNTENQTEIPLSALKWIIQSITHDFWQGNLPKTQHTMENTFNNETILLCRSMNAGSESEKGFKISNKSRSSHIMASRPQAFQITDEQIKKILIPLNEMEP